MSNAPAKTTGWTQGLYEQSATQKETLGCKRETRDGRTFRYAKAGGALAAGKHTITAPSEANHIKLTGVAAALGDRQVSVTVGATAVTENQYRDSYLQVYDGAAGTVGQQYLITGNTACDANGTTILQIEDPIRVAIIATDTVSLILNPYAGVTHSGTVANGVGGFPVIPVTSGYFCWLQTGGVACTLNQGATALGSELTTSTTSGALQTASAYTSEVVGHAVGYAAVSTKYCPTNLSID